MNGQNQQMYRSNRYGYTYRYIYSTYRNSRDHGQNKQPHRYGLNPQTESLIRGADIGTARFGEAEIGIAQSGKADIGTARAGGAVRMLRRSCALMFAVLLVLSVPLLLSPGASAADVPSVAAEAVVLADMDSGVILYEKNMNTMRSPASLTKIMTGLLAVEALESGAVSLDDVITAPADCWTGMDLDSSNAEILPGEKLTFKDYLYCALVKSANEACNVLAVAVDGSIQEFVNHMNRRASELGATRTYFSDTNGLSDTNHYTTAHDLFLITCEAMKHEVFVDAVNTVDYEIEETNMHAKRYLDSSNALLCQDGPYGDGYLYLQASGVKTGYTRKAGYCLVSTASDKGMNLCAVVLGCGGVLNTGEDGYGNFSATVKLYEWAFSNCAKKTLVTGGKLINRAPVKLALNNATAELRAADDLEIVLPKNYDDSLITTKISIYDDRLVAPVPEGQIVGKLSVYIDGAFYGDVSLYTASAVEADTWKVIMQRFSDLMEIPSFRYSVIASAVLIALILWIWISYRIRRRRHYQAIVATEIRRREERKRRQDSEKSYQAQEQMRLARENHLLDDVGDDDSDVDSIE